MHAYPVLSAASVLAVVLVELSWLRTGVFRKASYWISMAIVLAFQVPVDGWMARLSNPIVMYDRRHISGIRFPFDFPVEEFAYGFALVSLAIMLWERAGQKQPVSDKVPG